MSPCASAMLSTAACDWTSGLVMIAAAADEHEREGADEFGDEMTPGIFHWPFRAEGAGGSTTPRLRGGRGAVTIPSSGLARPSVGALQHQARR